MNSVDPTLTTPEVSTRAYRAMLLHFTRLLGEEVVDRVIEEAGLRASHLRASEQWVSLLFGERLIHGLLHQVCNEPVPPPFDHPVWQHWRQAGHLSVEREVFGPIWAVARALGSPSALFRSFPWISAQANRMTHFALVERGRGIAVLRADLGDGLRPDHPAYCWLRIGLLEVTPTMWGLPRAEVEHPRCIHHPLSPATACTYIVRYKDRTINTITTQAALATICAAAGGWLAADMAAPAPLLGASLAGLSSLSLERWWAHRRDLRARAEDHAILRQTLEEGSHTNRQLWEERKSLRRLLMANQKISGYLAPDVVQRIMDEPEASLSLGGERLNAAVLFCDIVGYTSRCEGKDPAQIVSDLNTFFGHIDPVIDQNRGVLDKRIGDAVMAVFVEQPDSPPLEERALSCALGILQAAQRCNLVFAAQGTLPLAVRVGAASGMVVQGNIGSALRFEHTVIGDVVNLAARLEKHAAPGTALITAALASHLPPEAAILRTDALQLRGRAQAVEVVEIGQLSGV